MKTKPSEMDLSAPDALSMCRGFLQLQHTTKEWVKLKKEYQDLLAEEVRLDEWLERVERNGIVIKDERLRDENLKR